MEINDIAKEVEAVLFAAGRKVGLEELKSLCKEQDSNKIKQAASQVKKKLDEEQSPLLLTEESDGYKLTVREKFLPLVQQIIPETELGRSVLETLAVIAWKQPVMQSEVVDIRTNKAYEHIAELEELGFVSKLKQGRSFILKTTQKFAEYFDIPTREEIGGIFKKVEEKLGKSLPGEEAQLKLGRLSVYSENGEHEPTESAAPELSAQEILPEDVEQEKEEEPEQQNLTEELFEEAEESAPEESALEALEEVEGGKEESIKPSEDEDKNSRKLPDQLESMLKTQQPEFLRPKEDLEKIEEEVEESEDIQDEEKNLEEEEKEQKKEGISVSDDEN